MAAPTTKIPTGSRPAPVQPLTVAKPKSGPTRVAAPAAPTAETRVAREHRATRDECATQRKELLVTDHIVKGKANNARPGSLRFNIIAAVQASKTVADACAKEVNGTGKYAETPYRVKKVDVGFCLGNGFITIKPR